VDDMVIKFIVFLPESRKVHLSSLTAVMLTGGSVPSVGVITC
jgi:hypothetical protein